MISRLQDCELYSGCKRREKINDKTKSMDINKFLRLKVYTKVKSFGPVLTSPTLCGPSLISAPAELVLSEFGHRALL